MLGAYDIRFKYLFLPMVLEMHSHKIIFTDTFYTQASLFQNYSCFPIEVIYI